MRYMLYGQLTACESLRDICLCLSAFPESLYGLGITASVNESTLSRANESRDYRIYEGLGLAIGKVQQRRSQIAYLLLARIKAVYDSPYSIT